MTDIIAPRQEAVLIEVQGENPVIVPQKEAVVVEVYTEAAIIVPRPEAVVIEVVERGPTGPTGPSGTKDHANLLHLDFDHSGHTGFQREIPYDPDLGVLLV